MVCSWLHQRCQPPPSDHPSAAPFSSEVYAPDYSPYLPLGGYSAWFALGYISGANLLQSTIQEKGAVQHFRKRASPMAFSTPKDRSISTLINPTQGDEQFSVDEITDVVVTKKDELDSGHELPDHSGVGEEKIPVIGMSFGSLPLAQKFYANYAKKVGFVTKIRNMNFDKMRKESKIPVNQSIYCTREGYRESRGEESWVVSRLELRYSHPCSAKKVVHYHEYRELTMQAKCVITYNDEAGIRPNKTYLALANEVGGSSNLGFSEKDVRNYITSNLRCFDDNEDFQGMMNYFVRMKEINPDFFYTIYVDDANKFRSALWVDARCRALYECYGDVVSFDTTYRRNRHDQPFASFVSVNHHGSLLFLAVLYMGARRSLVLSECSRSGYRELNAMMNHIVWNSPSTESFEVDWAGFIKQINLGQNRWTLQLGVRKKTDCVVRSIEQKGDTISIKVDGQKVFWGKLVYHTFIVEFDPLSRKGQCECNKFESARILCCHTFAVWSYYRVDTVPSCYVIPRLSKNVIHKHTYIKSSHDVARNDESDNLFRHLCSEFYNVS
ncbi:Protein FAR1-RELATED SEQUENCE [Arachis hypogaea]|nr:Protein FAR1-RELATED SEQUENCE [Arachis hypogaea]